MSNQIKPFRQCVNLAFDLGALGATDKATYNINPLNLNYIPDEVIVKQCTYTIDNTAPENITYQVWTNLTEFPILCTFQGSSSASINLDNHFTLRGYTNRSFNFQIQRADTDALITGTDANGMLCVLLEFVRN